MLYEVITRQAAYAEYGVLVMIRSAAVIYFSPTGTTKKYAHRLCASLGITDVDVIDLTRPSARLGKYRIDKEFVVITSYSIHYTKLYDERTVLQQPGF